MTTLAARISDLKGGTGTNPDSKLPGRMAYAGALTSQIPRIVRWSFLLFVFTLPFEVSDLPFISDGSVSLGRISALFFFAVYLFHYNPFFQKRAFPQFSTAMWWFFIYIIIVAMSALTVDREFLRRSIGDVFRLAQLLILFWIAASLLKQESMARSALLTFSIASVLLALATLLGLPGFAGVVYGRATALDFNPNYVSALMAYAAVSLIGLSIVDKIKRPLWQRSLLLISILPVLALMVSTGSRAGIGAFLIGVMMYLLPYKGSKRKIAIFLLALLALSFVVYKTATHPIAAERWQNFAEGHSSRRDIIFSAAFDMISERPVFGWQPAVAFYELGWRGEGLWRVRDAHNLFLYLLLQVGLVGIVPFLVGLCICSWGAWKARVGTFGLIPLVLFTTMLAYNMTHTGLNKKTTWLVLAFMVAAASTVDRSKRTVKNAYMVRGSGGRRWIVQLRPSSGTLKVTT